MSSESPAEKTDQLPVTKDALKHIPKHEQPKPASPVAPKPKMFRERRDKRA
jgi:hypothetical protein